MLEQMGKSAREASWHLAQLSAEQKNQALLVMADLLEQQEASILAAMKRYASGSPKPISMPLCLIVYYLIQHV